MPVQDRTGDDYEQILAASLVHLGYEFEGTVGKNYLHPPKRARNIIIPNTYIQPDLVVREDTTIQAIIYVTHWSNTRDSKRKFWRTWEEAAQQKLAVSHDLLTISCIFEALPTGRDPDFYINSDELPKDLARNEELPLQLNGWDPGVGWAMLEAFDISIIFPVGYEPVFQLDHTVAGNHDPLTSQLLKQALSSSAKVFFLSQWQSLEQIRQDAQQNLPTLTNTQSRYRIGLLHVYLFYRITVHVGGGNAPNLTDFVTTIVDSYQGQLELNRLATTPAFAQMGLQPILQIFNALSTIFVRKGRNAKTFCTLLAALSNPILGVTLHRVKLNEDLHLCLQDLRSHINEPGFTNAIQRSFNRFDQSYGLDEVIDDLVNPNLIIAKEAFVRQNFAHLLNDVAALAAQLQIHAKEISTLRSVVSQHEQNWVLEMLLYIAGLNSAEDIQKRFKENFEQSGHKVRPHAPYGDHAKLVAFLLQGRDICEQWSDPRGTGNRRTLTENEFRTLSWDTVALCITQGFHDENSVIRPADAVIKKYSENKSMRIISSDLNGFYIMLEHYLGGICHFQFTDEDGENREQLNRRICPSWQTEVISRLWGGRPLETWMEGVSHNGQWLIKVQSAQDGHESDKTKELAGRCRALRLAWSHGADPRDRLQWSFSQRPLPKLALVLDGDWDAIKKRNLYEAGWDWVGDVSQLHELRQLIQETSPT